VRALLDTHTFLWWLADDRRLSRRARAVIARAGNELLFSAASAWEIATKVRLGKLADPAGLAEQLGAQLAEEGFVELAITVEHGRRAGALPAHHKDPWDRMLVAQAQAEGIAIVSNERIFERYGVERVW
jgi:PIN domain nuclease of toxin-antitoxin system